MKELKTAGVRLPDSPLVPYPSRSLVPERDVRYTPVLEASRLGIDFGGLRAVNDVGFVAVRGLLAGQHAAIAGQRQRRLAIAERCAQGDIPVSVDCHMFPSLRAPLRLN